MLEEVTNIIIQHCCCDIEANFDLSIDLLGVDSLEIIIMLSEIEDRIGHELSIDYKNLSRAKSIREFALCITNGLEVQNES